MHPFLWSLLLAIPLMGITESAEQPRYLALGDSYTCGEGVPADARWPVELARRLSAGGVACTAPEIIATTGWTTRELLAGIAARHPQGPYALVTVQIGVNDQFRGGGLDAYQADLKELLAVAVGFAGGRADHVLVLSIPDWGVTPFAAGQDRAGIAAAIDAFNAVGRAAARKCGARYVDVTPSSREAARDRALLAGDGLHPSALLYARWAELAAPLAHTIITER